MAHRSRWTFALPLALVACGSSPAPPPTAIDAGDAGGTADGSQTDARTADAAGNGGDAGDGGSTPWSCLGSVHRAAPATPMLSYALTVSDVVLMMPTAGILVKACNRADVMCATPVAMGTSDAMGHVALALPLGASGFDGFFDLSGPGLVPSRNYLNPPLTEATPRGEVVFITQNELIGAESSVGATPDATRGALLSQALDCQHDRAPGVVFTASTTDHAATPFYVVGTTPSTTVTATDDVGAAGVFNLPAGPVTLSAQLADTHQRVGSVDVVVVAGGFTYVDMVPGP